MLNFEIADYELQFRFEARTSRNSMTSRRTWFIRITDSESGRVGVGECNLFQGLSAEDTPDFEMQMLKALGSADLNSPVSVNLSSVRFGLETALRRLQEPINNAFTRGEAGIPINGLIWMGDKAMMQKRIDEKLSEGFKVLKLKIGGIDFDSETDLLKSIRSRYSPKTLDIRLDANGSFTAENVMSRLERLSKYHIHSIEQPLRAGLIEQTAWVCARTPIPVALDEELIGVRSRIASAKLLDDIKPQYIILKPALCGGFTACDIWIEEAQKRKIGWWLTSALESDVGLFSIAEYAASRGVSIPQGLGTGLLYINNVESPLELRGDSLWYNPRGRWTFPELTWHR